jgi:putative two-component system response regulator
MHHIEIYKNEVAAILVDLMMSQEDDCVLLKSISQYEWYKEIPVLVIMGNNSITLEKHLFEYGISECIRRPFDANLIKLKMKNTINLFAYKNELEKKVADQNVQLHKQNDLLRRQTAYLRQSNENITSLLGTIVEYRDLECGEHIQRVKKYTQILAYELMEKFPEYGLTKETADLIISASPLHDIGKIAIPNDILLKPGKLTEEEFDYLKSHTLSGCEMIEKIEDTWSDEYKRISMEICHYHHERYDGKGYPEGISGDQIPISAQLVSIADAYDALVNERIYKDAIPKDKAFRMIIYGECGAFSPKLLICLSNCRTKMEMVQ